ncbi:hypothetical protein AB0J83_14895 [Actinoplanes sp. NPDC049596]|uniref:hypothetical protein n=1 Tax=unclassified Actinoplanes TaxID=2626549 RepID=UPI0034245517
MKTYQLTLGLAGALALTVSGCGVLDAADEPKATGASQTSPTKVSVATPRDALLQAVPDAKVGAYAFDIKGGVTPVSGMLDAPHKTTQVKAVHSEDGITLTMHALAIADKGWMKMSLTGVPDGFPAIPKKWMLIDPAKVKDKDDAPVGYNDETDPGYTALIVQNSAGVKETTAGHYAGTTDLTASTDAEIVEDATLTALGAKAKAVPFEAVIGPEGHLSLLTVKIPAAGKAKATTYKVTYAGFGKTATPKAPTDTAKPTDTVYEMLNS